MNEEAVCTYLRRSIHTTKRNKYGTQQYIFVYKENKNIFVFVYICIKKLWKDTKKVDQSGFFERGGESQAHGEQGTYETALGTFLDH